MGALLLLAQRAVEPIRALGVSAANYAAILVLALAGGAFLVAALFMLVASALGPMATAAVFGVVLVAIALIWAAVIGYQAREAKRRRREQAASTAVMASSLSLANTGLGMVSRRGGRLLLPFAGVAFVIWLLNRGD